MSDRKEIFFRHLFKSFSFFLVVAIVLSILIEKRYGYYVLQSFLVFEMIYSIYFFVLKDENTNSS